MLPEAPVIKIVCAVRGFIMDLDFVMALGFMMALGCKGARDS